jgi:hypothetical protein
MVKIVKLLLILVFVNAYIHFRIWTRIRIQNPRVTDPDPAKVPHSCGSGSTTLIIITADNIMLSDYKQMSS